MTGPAQQPGDLAPPAGQGGPGLSTFLLTDIEGSTRLWEEHAGAMGSALAVHDDLLRSAIEGAGGTVVKTMGDGVLAVFADPAVAVGAAIRAQRHLRSTDWGRTGPLKVRMAIHTGPAESRDGDYFGPSLNRCARILAIGHGGQVLASAVTAILARDRVDPDVSFLDCGPHRLRDLDRPEQVFQVAVEDMPQAFPPLRSLSTRGSNLPVLLTSFVGREQHVADVRQALERARLVTLIGTGGTGKTRLMLQAAGGLVGRYPDGVWLTELAQLADPVQIGPEIARALGAPEVAGLPAVQAVSDFVASKELLLLLDNAEHLIDAVAQITDQLLAHAPGLRIVTTSREALAVPGEVIIQVPSLAVPTGGSRPAGSGPPADASLEEIAATEAVRLFSERATSVLPSFELTSSNVDAVVEICRRLDGIPLAIELAAARVSSMSPEEIAFGLGDRFRLLAGGRRTAVPRQQTLHALIDWSWDLLTDDDRRLLRRLSIFAGGWTVISAASVVGDGPGDAATPAILDGLTRLVDRSLVNVDRGTTTRYRMLETIRQYARERLVESGEAESIADRHFAHFAVLAEAAAAELKGAAMVDWLDRLDAEIDNLDTALGWGLETDPQEAIGMATSMLSYWDFRVASSDNDARIVRAIEIARQAVAASGSSETTQRARAAALLGQAALIWAGSGRGEVALAWSSEAIELARSSGDRAALFTALVGNGLATAFSGASGDIASWFHEALGIAAELGDWNTVAVAAGGAAGGMAPVDPDGAEAFVKIAMDAARRTVNPYAIAMTAMGHGRLLGVIGRTDEAIPRLQEAIDGFTTVGDQRLLAACRSELGHALRRNGRLDEALQIYQGTVEEWVRLGNRGAVASLLENIAFVAIARDQPERAARLLGAAEAIREESGNPMVVSERPDWERWVERLRAAGESATVDADWASGRALSTNDAVALARN